MLTTIYAAVFYVAFVVLVGGLVYRAVQYAKTPIPLKIPTTPAPVTKGGVVLRIAREVVLFESLFKSNKWIWLFGWIFHFALLLVLMRHLRYFTQPVWGWVVLVQPFGKYAGFAMVAGLLALLVRRFVVQRVRYISAPSDYLLLLLLIAIGATGLAMKYVDPTNIVQLKAFFLGLMYFDPHPIPEDTVLLVHLGLVATLMIVFPISKLLHAPGLFFAPSRTMVDNPREQRYVSSWSNMSSSAMTPGKSDAAH